MKGAALSQPRLPPGTIIIPHDIALRMEKRGFDLAQFGAYHAAQDTRFRDFTTGGFANSSRREEDYFPRWDRSKVIARARVLFRNNPYIAAMLLAYVQEIGTPTMHSQTSDPAYNDAKERLFERWAKDCESDEDLSLDEVLDIWHFEEAIAGELFIIKRREGWLQLIASELCGSANNTIVTLEAGTRFADGTPLPAGATERDGVVRDANRFIIGYRFGRRNDQGAISFAADQSSIVQKQYVIHLASRQRTEQSRGVPLLVAVLNASQDLFETAHARAQQVKNASCLSLWITKNIDPYGFAETARGALCTGDLANLASLKEVAASRSAHQEVKAGAVMYGAAGETLTVVEPKLNAADFHEHYVDLAQIIAACLNGMPVEIAIEGFRASSYSSARATANKWKRNVIRIRRRDEQKMLQPVQLWQCNRAHIFGDLPPAPPSTGSVSYNTDEDVRFAWPAIPDIDGAKTSAQNAIDLANGTTTRTAIIADRGEYIDIEDKILVRERTSLLKSYLEEAKKLGLSPAAAEAWAVAQMPSQNASLLQGIIPLLVAPDQPVTTGANK